MICFCELQLRAKRAKEGHRDYFKFLVLTIGFYCLADLLISF